MGGARQGAWLSMRAWGGNQPHSLPRRIRAPRGFWEEWWEHPPNYSLSLVIHKEAELKQIMTEDPELSPSTHCSPKPSSRTPAPAQGSRRLGVQPRQAGVLVRQPCASCLHVCGYTGLDPWPLCPEVYTQCSAS